MNLFKETTAQGNLISKPRLLNLILLNLMVRWTTDAVIVRHQIPNAHKV